MPEPKHPTLHKPMPSRSTTPPPPTDELMTAGPVRRADRSVGAHPAQLAGEAYPGTRSRSRRSCTDPVPLYRGAARRPSRPPAEVRPGAHRRIGVATASTGRCRLPASRWWRLKETGTTTNIALLVNRAEDTGKSDQRPVEIIRQRLAKLRDNAAVHPSAPLADFQPLTWHRPPVPIETARRTAPLNTSAPNSPAGRARMTGVARARAETGSRQDLPGASRCRFTQSDLQLRP